MAARRQRHDPAAPVKAQVQRFVHFYTMNRDVSKAAQLAGIKVYEGEALYRDPHVRKNIDRRIHMIEMEQAKLEARATALNVQLLDSVLVEELNAKKSGQRLRAVELGYRRTGLIRDGEFFVPSPNPGPEKTAGPNIYRAVQTTTLRRTVTEEMIHQIPAPEEVLSLPEPEPQVQQRKPVVIEY